MFKPSIGWHDVRTSPCLIVSLSLCLLGCFTCVGKAQNAQMQQKMLANLAQMQKLIHPKPVTGPFEKPITTIDQQLNASDYKFTVVIQTIREAQRSARNNAAATPEVIAQLTVREYINQVKLIDEKVKAHLSLSWQTYNIGTLEKLLPAMPENAAKLQALIDSYKQMIHDAQMQNVDATLELAVKNGWLLKDFHYPSQEQRKILDELGVYEAKTHKQVNDGLKAYFTEVKGNMDRPLFEAYTAAYIKNPTDSDLRAKIATAFITHLKKLDLTNLPKARDAILPQTVFAEEPKDYGRPDLGKDLLAKYDLAYTLQKNSGIYGLMESFQWDLAKGRLDQIIEVYPYHYTMMQRAYVALLTGNNQEAFEYMAASVAVVAYQRAHTFNQTMSTIDDWYYQGVPIVMVLNDLANNQTTSHNPFPSVRFAAAMKYYRDKDWLTLANYVAQSNLPSYATPTADSALSDMFSFNRGFKKLLLDALAQEHQKFVSKADSERCEKHASTIGDRRHPYFELLRIHKIEDIQKKKQAFIEALNLTDYDSARHVRLNFAYAMFLSNQGEKDEAMLHYNIAAGGLPSTEVKDMQQTAAGSRDYFEGKDPKAIFDKYVALSTGINEKIKNKQFTILHNAQLDALITRLATIVKLRPASYLMRCDARNALRDYAGANEDLDFVIKSGDSEKNGYLLAMMGLNYTRLYDDKKAIATFDAASTQPGTPNWLYYYRGVAYRQQGQHDKALADINKMLQLDPNDMGALYERSELYEYHFKQYANAKADLEKYKTLLKKKDPRAQMMLYDMRLYNLSVRILRGE
jgi:tetratricopeptide (TPR) repeat protein